MIEPEDKVAAVIDAAGGTLVSRVRLQKTVYLLDQLGMNSGFEYEYHHFGPYSRDLDIAAGDARALGFLTEEIRHRASDGASYSVFTLQVPSSSNQGAFGSLGKQGATKLARLFSETHVTVLELAATAHWLWKFESIADWRTEIARRKPMKIGSGRLDRAVALLREVGLELPERPTVAVQGTP